MDYLLNAGQKLTTTLLWQHVQFVMSIFHYLLTFYNNWTETIRVKQECFLCLVFTYQYEVHPGYRWCHMWYRLEHHCQQSGKDGTKTVPWALRRAILWTKQCSLHLTCSLLMICLIERNTSVIHLSMCFGCAAVPQWSLFYMLITCLTLCNHSHCLSSPASTRAAIMTLIAKELTWVVVCCIVP